jgi:segregation and condensation protein A
VSYTYQNPKLTISEVIGQPSSAVAAATADADGPSGGDKLKPYEVHTPVFEGPLPLLLHLIEKEKLDITQVALAKVTDQFLDYVEAMRQLDDGQARTSADPAGPRKLATIAEFLSVAAHLMLLKSRVLLPKPPDLSKQENAAQDDKIEDELVRQLRAYRQYKEAAQWLRERNHAGLRAYVGVTAPPKPQRIHLDLSDVTVETLQEAAQRLLYPQEGPRPQEAIQRPRISVVQQINLIRDRLKHWKQVVFHALLKPQPTRLEAVVTLQAILELVKQRMVQAVQPHPFGEILIEATVPPDEIESS